MRKLLLVYHMEDTRLGKLRYLCLRLGITVKPVVPADFGLPLAVLCGLEQRPEAAPEPVSDFPDEMLVMYGFSGNEVNALLSAMKQFRFASVALKAIATPTNLHWSSTELHAQLSAEHQAMQAGRPLHEAPAQQE